jgi:hypothetical protein
MPDLPRRARFDNKINGSSRPFHEVNRLFESEVVGLIKILFDDSLSESIRLAIRKYLTVILFAALDYFFRNSVRTIVDKNDLNVDSIFAPESESRIDRLIRENDTTSGTIVASTYRFVDFSEIDFVFSNLLGLNSF